MNLHHLLTQYGYAAVFLFVGAESLGVPVPGETALITAAIYAGTTHNLSVWLIFVVAAIAAIIGDNIGYLIGEKGGYRLLRRYGHYVRADATKIKIGRLIFDRHGPKVVFFGRFITVLRTYAAFLAGTMKMAWRRFLPYNAAGGIVWAAVYSFLPYALGNTIATFSTPVDIALIVITVIIVIVGILLVRHHAAKLAGEAEAAYPGPLPDR